MESTMKKNLKTVSVAIPKKQFRQILDFMEQVAPDVGSEKESTTVASFLRQAITEFLVRRGYDEVEVEFAIRQGRPARRR